ncbi:hypothetical protein H9M94_01990 [Mycoplasma sp. Pen4]|uniref:hypothetical protein n=1 Tax=Mycoplasma sp. Pen4 TaxID=640330 RepID=UPI0016540778|nr:hypothetical protein [Mycoplasma sp. Pen4]QNM93377.1 hypothetical protein H9M94_01990 [Mycoplasma sp. Pen4]
MKKCLRCKRNYRNCRHVKETNMTYEEFVVINTLPLPEPKKEVVEEVVETVAIDMPACGQECCIGKDECVCPKEETVEVVEEVVEEPVQEEVLVEETVVVEEPVQEEVVEAPTTEYLSMETREEKVFEPIGGARCGGNCKGNHNAIEADVVKLYEEKELLTTPVVEEVVEEPVQEEVMACGCETVCKCQEKCKCEGDYTLVPVFEKFVSFLEEIKNSL